MIFVTGAVSYIGKHLLRTLAKQGVPIVMHVRSPEQAQSLPTRLTEIEHLTSGDLSNRDTYRRLPSGIHQVFHLAASGSRASATNLAQNNCTATTLLTEYAVESGVGSVVFLSSVSAFGEVPSSVHATPEWGSLRPGTYGASKLFGEEVIRSARLPALVLRLPGVLGPGASVGWLPSTILRLRDCKPVSVYAPDSAFNEIVHVEDVVTFLASLIHDIPKTFTVASAGTRDFMTVMQVVNYLRSRVKSTSEVRLVHSNRSPVHVDPSAAFRLGYPEAEVRDVLDRHLRENS